MTFTCIIIDDEPPAHIILKNYISKLTYLNLVGEFHDAFAALEYLQTNKVDILFLDINMPDLSGIEMIKSMQNPPKVIFTTAYSEFALEGYDLGVVDYLMKPIRFDRFLKAVHKVTENVKVTAELAEEKETHYYVKADGILHKVLFENIEYVVSKGNFVQIHAGEKPILTAETLSNTDAKLKEHGFLRVHKSYIVNIQKVKGVEGNQLLMNNTKIPIGLSYKQVVLGELGL